MAAHNTPDSSEQVLEAVWTKFEPITSPTSRLRPEKQPKIAILACFRYSYGNFERIVSDIMGIGCLQHSKQLCISIRSSLDQVWTNNDPLQVDLGPKNSQNRVFRYFYGNFERLKSDIMGIGCLQHSKQLRTGVRSSLDQVWSNNEPYKST